jgi:prolyl oligopeptidase
MGGSNGGLLVGATLVQRPELFNAVVCQVPLLDMLRYTKIAAGPSWIGEYGDPEDPKMAAAIRRYSPYQNVKRDVKYPEAFFLTSTKDDRVGPVHARKMEALLESQGHPALYWENIEGGHGAAADLEERVKMRSLQFTYLLEHLAD